MSDVVEVPEKVLLSSIIIRGSDTPPPPAHWPPTGNAFEELKCSIKKSGLLTPIFVNEALECISGHYRLWACKALGIRTVPVVVVRSYVEALEWFSRRHTPSDISTD